MVGKVFVGKDMHKELALRFQKAVHLFQQIVVIFHVFKHLHRENEIVVLDVLQCASVVRDVALCSERRND